MMAEKLIYDGRLDSPYFIFIRKPHEFSDTDLLKMFGLGTYKISIPTIRGQHVIFADADGWTLISDDWGYTLRHMKTTRAVIRTLGKNHDVFACTVEDVDRSFDYVYYVNGELVREYEVHSPKYTDRQIHVNYGELLPNEQELLTNDGYHIGIELAASLGIKTRFTEKDLRVYVPPQHINSSTGAG